ncbi:hypothetical protein HWV62_12936 [Athelia sp. TMB]|nr:hypothetical protein HWV62_12936 [Athelia sp. TMB]
MLVFDYILQLDGTIEVRVSASGYLQAGFWEPSQKAYGTQIRDTTTRVQVDLDIAGTENSLLHTSTSQETVTQPWYDEDWGQTVIQQKITREYVANEDDAKLKYPVNFQGGYAIVNRDQPNKWSTPRGYSIHPGFSPVHNTVVGSKRLEHNADWARYNLAVSVRKDSEPSSSSMWNANLPGAPVVDFSKFFDGESLNQTDLVAWINVGTHHLPAAEDAPNTRTNTATSSFYLTPLNYFDHDISIDSTNAILLSVPKNPGDPFTFDDYGVRPAVCVPEAPAPFEYSTPTLHDRTGNVKPPSNMEETRRLAEMYHRIPMEL